MKILFWLIFVINIVFAGYAGYNQCTDADSGSVQDTKPLNADSIRLTSPDATAGKTSGLQPGRPVYKAKSFFKHRKTY